MPARLDDHPQSRTGFAPDGHVLRQSSPGVNQEGAARPSTLVGTLGCSSGRRDEQPQPSGRREKGIWRRNSVGREPTRSTQPYKLHSMATMNAIESFLISWLRPQTRGMIAPIGDGVSLGTRMGRSRSANQDRVLFARFTDRRGEPVHVCVLCDGMGGMDSGEQCAEIAVANFLVTLSSGMLSGRPPRDALRESAHQANGSVHDAFRGRGGSTIAAVMLYRHAAHACCVGDSRIFGLKAGELRQLSRDDTVQGALADGGRGPRKRAGRGAGVVAHHEVQVVVDVRGTDVVAVQHVGPVHLAPQLVERFLAPRGPGEGVGLLIPPARRRCPARRTSVRPDAGPGW